MNVLVTSSRMPVALDAIRKLGRGGHRVWAADTFRTAPGSHSRHVAGRVRVAPPSSQPLRFLADVKGVIAAHAIDLVMPCFEEVFYLARHAGELADVELFAPAFAVLARLHHKATFHALARELGIAAPDTTLVASPDELAAAVRAHPRFLARPVWSRGGLCLYTNAGPLAGALGLRDCHPTPERPWIVQEYVDGIDVCSFSIARHGRVLAHCTYVHPREIEHAGGIVFESIDEPATLAAASRLVEATGYHGQLGLDFRRSARGLVVLECNPRPTAGVHLMPDAMFVEAVDAASERAPAPPVRVVAAGARRKYVSALVRDMLLHGKSIPVDLGHLFSRGGDVFGEQGDPLPAFYQVLSYVEALAYRGRHDASERRRGTGLMASYFDGITWDGSAIP